MNSSTGQVASGFVPPTGEPTREKAMAMKAAVRLSDPTHRFHQPIALQLRFLQTVREISSEHNTTTILPLPIDIFEPFIKKAGGDSPLR